LKVRTKRYSNALSALDLLLERPFLETAISDPYKCKNNDNKSNSGTDDAECCEALTMPLSLRVVQGAWNDST